jgi:hypothetical protein
MKYGDLVKSGRANRGRIRPYANPATVHEKAAIMSDAEQAAACELADALEERFGGVIARDADKIALFVVLRARARP